MFDVAKLVTEGIGIVKHFFPEKMSEAEEKNLGFAMQQWVSSVNERAQEQFNTRVKELEGTASDLRQAGIFGRIILFFRGLQRPTWGFATLYADFMWFSGSWQFSVEQSNAMYVINFLVLGFLFGERTIKNLEPLLLKIFASQGN